MNGGGSRGHTSSPGKGLAAGAGQINALKQNENFEGRPHRIQRKRTKGWRMPEEAVYVGRGCGMPWGNPFKAEDAVEAGYRDGPYMAALAFRRWLAGDPDFKRSDPDPDRDFILANLGSLRGKNLACWCALDKPCHADVLLELANRSPSRSGRVS